MGVWRVREGGAVHRGRHPGGGQWSRPRAAVPSPARSLAEFASLDSAYLMVIDWDRRTQMVRFAHNVGAIVVHEGPRAGLAAGALSAGAPRRDRLT